MMVERLMVIGARVLEVMFFTGVIGCTLTIVVSWAEISADGFSESGPKDSGE
jgi:hypothetical protein